MLIVKRSVSLVFLSQVQNCVLLRNKFHLCRYWQYDYVPSAYQKTTLFYKNAQWLRKICFLNSLVLLYESSLQCKICSLLIQNNFKITYNFHSICSYPLCTTHTVHITSLQNIKCLFSLARAVSVTANRTRRLVDRTIYFSTSAKPVFLPSVKSFKILHYEPNFQQMNSTLILPFFHIKITMEATAVSEGIDWKEENMARQTALLNIIPHPHGMQGLGFEFLRSIVKFLTKKINTRPKNCWHKFKTICERQQFWQKVNLKTGCKTSVSITKWNSVRHGSSMSFETCPCLCRAQSSQSSLRHTAVVQLSFKNH